MVLRSNLLRQGMKPGFWTGVIAFMMAKVAHLLITFLIGFCLGYIAIDVYGEMPGGLITFLSILDHPIIGLIFLIFVTRWFYFELKKTKDER